MTSLRRGLAAPAAAPPGFLDQVVGEQPLGDVGDGRRGEPGDHRELGARDRTVDADRVQRHALIVIAGALEIGPRQTHVLAGAFAHRNATLVTAGAMACGLFRVGRERQRTQRPGHRAETRRHDELREALLRARALRHNRLRLRLSSCWMRSNRCVCALMHAATEKDARRRRGQHHGVHELRRGRARRNPRPDGQAASCEAGMPARASMAGPEASPSMQSP